MPSVCFGSGNECYWLVCLVAPRLLSRTVTAESNECQRRQSEAATGRGRVLPKVLSGGCPTDRGSRPGCAVAARLRAPGSSTSAAPGLRRLPHRRPSAYYS